ncbi:MAG: hypothetical protein CML66_21725 [Rhodobacteraceae bacterium]|nr:hypothetical protein [Paracoccaceae bacterium]
MKTPAEAARQVMALNIPRQVLWLALVVVSLLNTILLFLPTAVLNLPVILPGILAHPIAYFVMISAGLMAMIYVMQWVGLKMGGNGTLEDVASVIIWLQALRVAVQAVALILQFVFPLFTILLSVVVGLYSLYIILHFIDQALRLKSLGRSAGVLIASVLALAIAMTLLLALVGGPFGDPLADV